MLSKSELKGYTMAEIRLHPFTGERIIVNERRLQRPTVLEGLEDREKECPFCPTSTKRHPGLPQNYETISIINLFSALTEYPESVISEKNTIYQKMDALGICEVVLYTDNHDMMFYNQPIEKIISIIELWQEREHKLGRNKLIKYVYTFENRGVGVGVTIHHPHGQIYALPFIPPYISQKLNSSKNYYKQQSSCLHCQIILQEKATNVRIVNENAYFIAFAPFYSRLLYEIHVYPKRHLQYLSELNTPEIEGLALIIKEVRRKYDRLL